MMLGRDAVDGYVWLRDPSINKGGGPERVSTEEPPSDWAPAPLLGFAAPRPPAEPDVWEGDQA